MYPAANTARITATTMNAAGIPVSPVTAYAEVISPAATVSGATAARMNERTAGLPIRLRASDRDTVPRLAACVVMNWGSPVMDSQGRAMSGAVR